MTKEMSYASQCLCYLSGSHVTQGHFSTSQCLSSLLLLLYSVFLQNHRRMMETGR